MDNLTTNPAPGVAPQASPEDRIAAILGKQDTASADEAEPAPTEAAPETPQETAPVEQAQTDELTADDLPDEQAEAPSESGDEFEIVHNGQARKLTREETIRLAQQGFDYTVKTQQVAETAKVVNERLQRLEQVQQVQELLLSEHATVKALESQLAQYQNIDWVRLATDDPLEYPKHRAQYDSLVQSYNVAARAYGAKAEAVGTQLGRIKQDMLAQEAAILPKLVPAWSDPAKFEAAKTEMVQYLRSQGVDPQMVAGKYLDNAFALKTLYQSMQYEKLHNAKRDKVKQLRSAPPVVRPGASQPPTSASAEKEKQAQQRLRKSGSLEDAASLLLNRMK